jgi:hypothetical protein
MTVRFLRTLRTVFETRAGVSRPEMEEKMEMAGSAVVSYSDSAPQIQSPASMANSLSIEVCAFILFSRNYINAFCCFPELDAHLRQHGQRQNHRVHLIKMGKPVFPP